MFLGYTVKQLLSICAICNVISPIKYVLYFYISTYWSVCVCVCVCVCSVQYGCFLQFFNLVLSRYVAQVLSEWFWDGPSRPSFTGITFQLSLVSGSFIIVIVIVIIVIVVVVVVVVVESELYEHSLLCVSSSKLRGKEESNKQRSHLVNFTY